MHRQSDSELQAEMKRLLDGIAVKWLRPKVGVSRQTIYDWRAGKGVTMERLIEVANAVNRPLFWNEDTTKAAPPAWVERLLAGTMALETKADVSATELDQAEADALAWLATAEQRRQHRLEGDGGEGTAGA